MLPSLVIAELNGSAFHLQWIFVETYAMIRPPAGTAVAAILQ